MAKQKAIRRLRFYLARTGKEPVFMIFAGNDLTAENANFIGLAKYDGETGFMSFRQNTGETRGDEGTFL